MYYYCDHQRDSKVYLENKKILVGIYVVAIINMFLCFCIIKRYRKYCDIKERLISNNYVGIIKIIYCNTEIQWRKTTGELWNIIYNII